jgi:hypothetical protein
MKWQYKLWKYLGWMAAMNRGPNAFGRKLFRYSTKKTYRNVIRRTFKL